MNKNTMLAIIMFTFACDIDPLLHRPKLTATTPEQSVCKAACQQSFLSCYEDAAVRCKYRYQGNCPYNSREIRRPVNACILEETNCMNVCRGIK